jgi:hypothetical protein
MPKNPIRIDQVVDKNFAYCIRPRFNHEGRHEGSSSPTNGAAGSRPRCRPNRPNDWGPKHLRHRRSQTGALPAITRCRAPQSDQENCVAHNGSLIPVPVATIMVQCVVAGRRVRSLTHELGAPVETRYFDPAVTRKSSLVRGGYWSGLLVQTNGANLRTEIARGIDDYFRLKPMRCIVAARIDAAEVEPISTRVNTQVQKKIVWPRQWP